MDEKGELICYRWEEEEEEEEEAEEDEEAAGIRKRFSDSGQQADLDTKSRSADDGLRMAGQLSNSSDADDDADEADEHSQMSMVTQIAVQQPSGAGQIRNPEHSRNPTQQGKFARSQSLIPAGRSSGSNESSQSHPPARGKRRSSMDDTAGLPDVTVQFPISSTQDADPSVRPHPVSLTHNSTQYNPSG